MNSNITITDNGKFLTLKCADDLHKITTWVEGDAIEDYNSFTIAYVALTADTDKFHCISLEDDEKYTKLRDDYIEEKHRKEEEEHNIKIEN